MHPNLVDGDSFSYYEDFFHDGTIFKITKTKKGYVIEMESSTVYEADNRDSIPLSINNTLYGNLHIEDIVSMRNNKESVSSIEMQYDYADVLRCMITGSSLFVCGDWREDGGREALETRIWFEIEVEAKKIYWENTANIEDPALYGKYKGIIEPPSSEEPNQ